MHAECDPKQADPGRRRASRVLLCACAALAACGSTSAGENPLRPVEQSAPQTPTGTTSERPVAAEVALAPQGFMELASSIYAPSIAAPEASARLACGRVGALPLSDEVPLLGGRLMIRGVQGAAIEPRPWNIMGAPEPVESETRLFLDTGREKVVVMAYELFALAGTDFIEQVRQDASRAFPDTRLEHIGAIGEGLEGIQVVPATLDTSREAVFTFGLYLVSPNRTIQVIAFYVSPPAATDREACVGLAMRSARTLRVGEAALNFGAQEWRLTTGVPNEFVSLTLPDRHVVITQEGPDFFVHRVSQLAVFGQPSAGGMLYFGGHPSRDEHAGARELEAPLLGTNTTWAYWTDDRAHAEALRPLNDHLFAHAMANGPDEASLSTLVQAFGRATPLPISTSRSTTR